VTVWQRKETVLVTPVGYTILDTEKDSWYESRMTGTHILASSPQPSGCTERHRQGTMNQQIIRMIQLCSVVQQGNCKDEDTPSGGLPCASEKEEDSPCQSHLLDSPRWW
jgi:hypothetical protein